MKKTAGYLLSLVIAVMILVPYITNVSALTLEEARQQKSESDAAAANAKRNAEILEQQLALINQQKSSIEQEKYYTNMELESKMDEVQKINKEITELFDSVEISKKNYEEKQDQLKQRLKTMYKNSNSIAYMRVVLNSKNLNDVLQRLYYLKKISKADKKVMTEFANAKADYETKLQLANDQKVISQEALNKTQGEVDYLTLQQQNAEYEAEVNKQNIAYWQKVENDFKAQSLIAQSIILKAQNSNSAYNNNGMMWPTPGYGIITQYFGVFPHPIFGYMASHDGIDIGAPYGADIVAASAGTVIYAQWMNGYGNTVIVDHGGGITTLYAHGSSIAVYEGQVVDKGQTVSYIGSTGWSTGPHLHFEVRINGAPVDPLNYVAF